jgi:DNA topoisomerase-1
VVLFDGYYTLYHEDQDDPAEDDENNRRLPNLQPAQNLKRDEVKPERFTEPPPRFRKPRSYARWNGSASAGRRPMRAP